jgi:hypothetical protein
LNTHIDKTQEKKSQSASNAVSQMQAVGESTFQFLDNRPEAIAQMKLQELAENSPQVSQLKSLQDMANNSVIQRAPFDKDGKDLGAGPQVRDIYSTARGFFGSFGAPQIKEIHDKMEADKDPLLSKPAGIMSGYEAGQHENEMLRKKPMSGDWRDDKFAKHPFAMAARPIAAAFTGGAFRVMDTMSRGMKEHQEMKTGIKRLR